jgi:hypothetical protein
LLGCRTEATAESVNNSLVQIDGKAFSVFQEWMYCHEPVSMWERALPEPYFGVSHNRR